MSQAIPMHDPVVIAEETNITENEINVSENEEILEETLQDMLPVQEWVSEAFSKSLHVLFTEYKEIVTEEDRGIITKITSITSLKSIRGKFKELTIAEFTENKEPKYYNFEIKK